MQRSTKGARHYDGKNIGRVGPEGHDLTQRRPSCLPATELAAQHMLVGQANNDGQFTLPHPSMKAGQKTRRNSIYHCDMTADDIVVVQPDALGKFNKCKNTDDKHALVKLYEKAVDFVEQQLEAHAPDLKPQAVPILITAIAIAALILLKLLSAIFGGGRRKREYPYPMLPPWAYGPAPPPPQR